MGFGCPELLVLWREDEPAEERLAMVDKFVRRCRSAGLVSIIEPVVRPPRRGWDFDRESAIVAAAAELGGTEHRGLALRDTFIDNFCQPL